MPQGMMHRSPTPMALRRRNARGPRRPGAHRVSEINSGPLAPEKAMDLATFERLVRVEAKLDAMADRKGADHLEFTHDIADHETRLRALERVWWRAAGIAAVVSAAVATGASALISRAFGG